MISTGIVLAGGTGSRPWMVTRAASGPLLPAHDTPMVWCPLSTRSPLRPITTSGGRAA